MQFNGIAIHTFPHIADRPSLEETLTRGCASCRPLSALLLGLLAAGRGRARGEGDRRELQLHCAVALAAVAPRWLPHLHTPAVCKCPNLLDARVHNDQSEGLRVREAQHVHSSSRRACC